MDPDGGIEGHSADRSAAERPPRRNSGSEAGGPEDGGPGRDSASSDNPGGAGAVATGSGGRTEAVGSAAEALGVIVQSRDRARRALKVNNGLFYGVWAVALGGGYLTLWAATRLRPQNWAPAWAFVMFGVLIAGAIALSILHSASRMAAIRGPRRWTWAAWGCAWGAAFAGGMQAATVIAQEIASVAVAIAVYNTVSCLIVGCLYMGAGSMLGEKAMYGIGAWMVVVAAVGAVVAVRVDQPTAYLVIALASGGGLAAGAVISRLKAPGAAEAP
ncbi:MAG: hypothetical protein LBS27_03630 [Bifidobacteriaceae bacterium]|jgi:hypothetical protein|nr:hypothetical protein [Bifidobacteriaceae bacterium]